ncbi:MAG: sulfatase-like hydrolase/transferase [Planctomycetaceae bacterium]|nr:sulfatase-like hydrolase/transferase [Planctomycetaceae bacterium]
MSVVQYPKNAIVLVVDGLHAGFVGAYGNSSVMTPALDRFACDALLCDRYYADTLDLARLYREFWYGISPEEPEEETPPLFPSLPKRLEEKGYRTILLTDDPEIAYSLYADGFSEVHNMDHLPPAQPVASLEETQFFRMFATIVDLATEKDEPYFLWCHFKGFSGPWDFPMEYRNEYTEEEDPPPYNGVAVPRLDDREQDEPDPDERQSVVEAYSGGVTVLDEAFAGFLESLTSGPGENTLTVFTAARGFSLGEHRLIGLPAPEDIWGENLHLPLMLRLPEQLDKQMMVRSTALTQPCDLFATLAEWFELSVNDTEGKNLLRLLDDEDAPLRKEIRIQGDATISAVMQSDWFFRIRVETDEFQEERRRIELYAKPGDRYEVNEIADRCEEIVEQMKNEKN